MKTNKLAMKINLRNYFNSWWLPIFIFLCLLVSNIILRLMPWAMPKTLANILLWISPLAIIGIAFASIANLIHKRWLNFIANLGLFLVTGVTFVLVLGSWILGATQMQDGYADNLTIPKGIEIAEPERVKSHPALAHVDEFQTSIRRALAVPGNGNPEFTPAMPSLRKASTDHYQALVEYIEASPDWHVFAEGKKRFAARRWSYDGEPKNELYGSIAEFGRTPRFQTQCLLSLDRKQWSRNSVQTIQEGHEPVVTKVNAAYKSLESYVNIESGGVWVEILEQSDDSERRITKATVTSLEKEFAKFLENPAAALSAARARSSELARLHAGDNGQPFRLIKGWDPGQYDVAYSLNPGEPGFVYLKAFEVTRETPLSVHRLKSSSKTRISWSADTAERFWAKESITIFEGDWGKPYAARFEVWFEPESGQPGRKLAHRVYKIEGWQR